MSSVIKSTDKAVKGAVKPIQIIRTLGAAPKSQGAGKSAREQALEDQILALETENSALKETLKQQAETAESLIAQIKTDAKTTAEAEIKKNYSDSYDVLAKCIERVSDALEVKIDTLDGLALMVAQTALENVFNPQGSYKDLVARSITKQVGGLRQEAILYVQVSSQDFETDEALEDLVFALDLKSADIKTSSHLKSGDCVMDLRLGQVEISIQDHWEALQSLFVKMAKDEGEI